MNHELDPRLEFYLENKSLIDEWAKLADLEKESADKFFGSLADGIREVVPELPSDPEFFEGLDGAWRKLLLHRKEWGTNDLGRPIVGVGVGWEETSGFSGAYVGVLIDKDDPRFDRLMEILCEDLPDENGKKSGSWPTRSKVAPVEAEFWKDLNTFADQIVSQVTGLWERSVEVIDQAFQTVNSSE